MRSPALARCSGPKTAARAGANRGCRKACATATASPAAEENLVHGRAWPGHPREAARGSPGQARGRRIGVFEPQLDLALAYRLHALITTMQWPVLVCGWQCSTASRLAASSVSRSAPPQALSVSLFAR